MPALHYMAVLLRHTAEGRRRTSPEGGNRGPRSGELGRLTVYGDLRMSWVADAVKNLKRGLPTWNHYLNFTLM